ncbi:MAG: PhoH family protein [Chitinivibrionales bacterium]|nr:PhoH family protein [Chitinivibrionales bacterium]
MKNYVLDTTVLLYEPQALFAFDDNNVIIPITIIEDIDRFKKDLNENGRNARQTSRLLDELRTRGSLTNGVKLPNGGTAFVAMHSDVAIGRLPAEFRDKNRDHFLLAIALNVKDHSPRPTILVTKDLNLRIKADTIGIPVEDYKSDQIDIGDLYKGYRDVALGGDQFDAFVKKGLLENRFGLFPHEFGAFSDLANPARKMFGKTDLKGGLIVKIDCERAPEHWRLTPRNREQWFAMHALMQDDIQLVTLLGKAGTGKTLLAVAAALYKTVDENIYNRILVSRPTLPMGKDIGFLPGTVEEKLTPWMSPIADNIDFIMQRQAASKRHIRDFKELMNMGILNIEGLTYIRGRSIHNQYLIIDEAQNLTPHEIKTVITRVGEGTKIVLTGDPYQIDNPYIDSSSNGLTYVVDKMKQQEISAHVTLHQGERSRISELAANIL